ncbi:MAG: hypothetical protein Kow0031_40130 [Anaerolineae bacterium]
MSNPLSTPGDAVEGAGYLLQRGRVIAGVYYHLSVPTQTHFLVNQPGSPVGPYSDFVSGFVLVPIDQTPPLSPGEYSLELSDKSRRLIKIERRYRQVKHRGRECVSYWVSVLPAPARH